MDIDFEVNVKNNVRRILIECRKEAGMTQTEVGKIVGKGKTAVANWEQGLTIPDIETLYRLAKYYGKTIGYMYGEEEEESK
jgi:transcriptional regulator with XRE-family HTH domain